MRGTKTMWQRTKVFAGWEWEKRTKIVVNEFQCSQKGILRSTYHIGARKSLSSSWDSTGTVLRSQMKNSLSEWLSNFRDKGPFLPNPP